MEFKLQLLPRTEGFMFIVPLNAFMTVRCTEAESAWRTEGPYGAPKQTGTEPWTTTQVSGHNSFRERTDPSSRRLLWNIDRQCDNLKMCWNVILRGERSLKAWLLLFCCCRRRRRRRRRRCCCLSSQTFPCWFFSCWTTADPHRSGFKLHTAVLSVLCVMFPVQLSVVVNLLSVFLVWIPNFP
jgi:hypothetical protein